jgi:hypothetical protein
LRLAGQIVDEKQHRGAKRKPFHGRDFSTADFLSPV